MLLQMVERLDQCSELLRFLQLLRVASSCKCDNFVKMAMYVIYLDTIIMFCVSLFLQVFVDGMEPVRKPLERMFEDSASEKSVRSLTLLCPP